MKNDIGTWALAALALAGLTWARGAGAQTPPPIKVACIGDSITFGYNLPNPATQSYPANLGRMLGPGYVVQNFGVSGRCMVKKGTYPYWNEAAFAQSQAWAPDVVVIQLGTNDTWDQNEPYQGEFVADYDSMIALYRALPSHPAVYVCLPPPITGESGNGYNAYRLGTEVMPHIRQVVADTGAPLIDNFTLLSGYPQDMLDTVHPDPDGAIRLAVNVGQAIALPGTQTPTIVNDTDGGNYATTVPGVPSLVVSPTGGGGLLGGFTHDTGRTAGDVRNDLHVSRTYGDSVTYTFVGTGVDFITEQSPQGASVDCSVDGQLVSTVSSYNPYTFVQQAVFSAQGLPYGTHTLQLVHRGPANPTAQAAALATTGVTLAVDAFRVYHPVADFALSPSAPATIVPRGGTGQTQVVVSALNGYAGATTFQIRGLPAGVSAAFANPPTGAGSVTLTLSATGTAAPGSVTATVEGDCGPVHRFVPVTLTVTTPAPHARLLWDNADGRVALWTVAGDGTAAPPSVYGPYSEGGALWKGTALATRTDGVSYLLWTHPSGKAILWTVGGQGNAALLGVYGPYADASGQWRAASLSAGPDGTPHLLWTRSDGRAALWTVNPDGTFTVPAGYGPYTDGSAQNLWAATAVATGPDNVSHLLWDNADGKAALWTVRGDGSVEVLGGYGPYAADSQLWGARSLSVGGDGVPHLLWTHPSGRAALWTVHADGTFTIPAVYGPYTDGSPSTPWAAVAVATGADGLSRLLWDNADGRASLWNGAADGTFAPTFYGPYTDDGGWTAVAVSTGP